ncbi:MAG: hypothetical protein DI618_04900 [Dermacoccus nishinomiyaensis]|nr:MAG: hypothetical protein DI618_04900 [Dermacoccus nishinomiyaensis]
MHPEHRSEVGGGELAWPERVRLVSTCEAFELKMILSPHRVVMSMCGEVDDGLRHPGDHARRLYRSLEVAAGRREGCALVVEGHAVVRIGRQRGTARERPVCRHARQCLPCLE